MLASLPISLDRITAFCQKWQVVEFAFFGSILRDDFCPDSDVDVLLVFAPEAPWSYWEYPAMQAELEAIFGRRVDMVEKQALTNPFRRHRILTTRKVIYRAALTEPKLQTIIDECKAIATDAIEFAEKTEPPPLDELYTDVYLNPQPGLSPTAVYKQGIKNPLL